VKKRKTWDRPGVASVGVEKPSIGWKMGRPLPLPVVLCLFLVILPLVRAFYGPFETDSLSIGWAGWAPSTLEVTLICHLIFQQCFLFEK